MPCTEVLCKCEAWWPGCAQIRGLTLEGWVHRLGPPRQDAVDGFIYQLLDAWSSRLLPHSFLTPENLGEWAQARSKAACSPQGPAHLGTWHSDGLAGGFLGYSRRAEPWPQSPQSPRLGPAQVG